MSVDHVVDQGSKSGIVDRRKCDCCGEFIEPGTGIMYVRLDGTVLYFDDSKCEKNIKKGNTPADLEWTEESRQQRSTTQPDNSQRRTSRRSQNGQNGRTGIHISDLDSNLLTDANVTHLDAGQVKMVHLKFAVNSHTLVQIEVYDDGRRSIYWSDNVTEDSFADLIERDPDKSTEDIAHAAILNSEGHPWKVPLDYVSGWPNHDGNDCMFVSIEDGRYNVSWERLSRSDSSAEITILKRDRDCNLPAKFEHYFANVRTDMEDSEYNSLFKWVQYTNTNTFNGISQKIQNFEDTLL